MQIRSIKTPQMRLCSIAGGLVAVVFPVSVVTAGYTLEINATGEIDAAVIYGSLFDVPGSAIFVDQAGGLSLGDPVGISTTFHVSNTGELSRLSIDGFFRTRTFGNRNVHNTSATGAVRSGGYFTAGEVISGYDIVYTGWQGSDDGLNEHGIGAHTLFTLLVLIAEPGTLVDEDGRILARSADEFSSLIIDAHIHMTWPNAFSYDSFATDPDFTITPAPGVLAPIALGVSFAARRRRQPRLAGACASLIEHRIEYDSGNQER